MAESQNHLAPGPASGFLFQFQRALFHLATGRNGTSVGIETEDDVAIRERDGRLVWEQDKSSLQETGNPFADRSKNLWNTLNIWLAKLKATPTRTDQIALYLVTNRPVPKCLARQISDTAMDDKQAMADCLCKLKMVANSDQADIQKLMSSVLSYTDPELETLISRIALLDSSQGTSYSDLPAHTIDALSLPAGVAGESVYHGLAGWLQMAVFDLWRQKKPAWIDFEAFNNRKYELIIEQRRDRVLGRPELQIVAVDGILWTANGAE